MDWTASIGRALGRVLPTRLLDHACTQNCAYPAVFEISASYQQSACDIRPSITHFAPSRTVSLQDVGTYTWTVSTTSPYSVVDDLMWQTHESIKSNSATLTLLSLLFILALLVVAFFFVSRICGLWKKGDKLVGLKARYASDMSALPVRADSIVTTKDDQVSSLQTKCDQQTVTIEQLLADKTRNEAIFVQTIQAMTQDRAKLEDTAMRTALHNSLCFTTTTRTLLAELRQVKDDKATSDSRGHAASTAQKQLEFDNVGLSSQVKDLQRQLEECKDARAKDAVNASEFGMKYNDLLAANTRLQVQSDELEEYKSKVGKLEDTILDCEDTIMSCNISIASQTSKLAEQQVTIASHEAAAMQQKGKTADHESIISGQRDTIKESNALILQRESTILDQGSKIAQQKRVIDESNATIIQQKAKLSGRDTRILEQGKTIADLKASIVQQKTTVTDHETQLEKQGVIIADLEATITEQRNTLAGYVTQITNQKTSIAHLEAVNAQQKTALAGHETMLARQQVFIADCEATIAQQKGTIGVCGERLKAQQVQVANNEAVIDIERSRSKQIETSAGLPLHARFVLDTSRKRMDAHGRSQRLAKVAKDFEQTARGFAKDAWELRSESLAAAKGRRHSVSGGSTRIEIASQLKGPAFTATSSNIRQRLADKKQRSSWRLSSTKIDFVIDQDIARKGVAQLGRTIRGSHSIDALDLALRARDSTIAPSLISLDEIRDDRLWWTDVTKFNVGIYLAYKEIAARNAAQETSRRRTQSKLNHILETLTPLGEFMKRHDLDKPRGSDSSLITRLGQLTGQVNDGKLAKLIGELGKCNEQIQRESERKIEQLIGDLNKWLLDVHNTEVSVLQDDADAGMSKSQNGEGGQALGNPTPCHDQEPKPDWGIGAAGIDALGSGQSYSSKSELVPRKDATSDMTAKQSAKDVVTQQIGRAVLSQGKEDTDIIAERETSTYSQADRCQSEGPQAKKKTRRKMKSAKNKAQPIPDDPSTTVSGQQSDSINVEQAPGLEASRFAPIAVEDQPMANSQAPATSVQSGLHASKFATGAVDGHPVIESNVPAAPVRSGLQASKYATSDSGHPEMTSQPLAALMQSERQTMPSQGGTIGTKPPLLNAPTGPRTWRAENEVKQGIAANHRSPASRRRK